MVDEQQPAESNHWAAYKIRHGKKRAFLSYYVQMGSVTAATEAAGVARCRHYEWLEEDPDYGRAFADARERYAEKLEAEADRRAVEGVDKPVSWHGTITDTYREYSDNLLMFRLKGLKPQMYRDNVHQTGDMDVRVSGNVNHNLQFGRLTTAELEELERIGQRLTEPPAS